MTARLRLAPLLILLSACLLPADVTPEIAAEFLLRHSRVDQRNPAALSELADWARDQGLLQQAAETYRQVLALSPDDQPAFDQLCAIADQHRLPEDPDLVADLLAQFGPGFSAHTAPHFIVIYNTDKAWALNRAVLLERTHDIFQQTFRRAGLRSMPLSRRLIVVLFATHREFAHYARRTDGLVLGWSSGYYSTRTNRIAFFNDEDNPQFDEVRRDMTAAQNQIIDLDQQIATAAKARNHALVSELRRQQAEARKQLRWYENRLAAVGGLLNTAKTIHEAVHQLAFNTGIQNRDASYPFWLSEGLATNFEATDPAAPFGPMHDVPIRRTALKEARDENQLLPLEKFITLTSPSSEPDDLIAARYAQAHGLFQLLFRKRNQQLRTYLRLAADQPNVTDPAAHRQLFQQAFGDLATLDRDWNNYLRQLR
jgi:tetratricopeptide (TPR) repeat protein